MSLSRYCVTRIDRETGEPKDLPLVTVFTASEVLEVMKGMFIGFVFETDNGPLEGQVLSPNFGVGGTMLTMSSPHDPSFLDYFLVEKRG